MMSRLWFLATLSAIICSFARVAAQCDSFTNVCAVALGQALTYTTGSNFIKLIPSGSYYLSFSMPSDTSSASLDLSIMFGSVQMFAAVNRQPSTADFDYTNSFSGSPDYLSIVPKTHAAGDKFNVLIRASPASAAYFTGVVTTTLKPVQLAVNGMPQTARMGKGSTMQFRFTVTSTAPLNVVATPLAASVPQMSLFYYPSKNSGPTITPDTYFNDDNDAADGFLSFTPKATDVGKNFLVELHAGNMSFVSVAVRAAPTPAGTTITGTAAQDPPVVGAPTHTVVLLNGQPQRDRVGEQQERYYVFYVPAGLSGPVTVSVDPIQGDSDLYVNPFSRGIYHRTGNDPEPAWFSMEPSGIESVTILPSARKFEPNGQAYYITVFGYEAAQYMVRVSTADGSTRLVEGYTVQDSVAAGAYKYYTFHDSDPTSTVYFNLLPTVGDADLYISCQLRPTGNDQGYPSKLIGHSNFSSALFMEDTITVTPSDPHSCSLGRAGDDSTHRGDGGTFYIGVYGFNAATFLLSAQHASGERTMIAGMPLSGIVYRGVDQRFKVRAGFEAAELRLLLTPMYGDADLYVKLNSAPTTSNYDYRSNNFNTYADSVTIPEGQMCSDCWVHVLITCFSTTQFSLVASFDDGTVVLANGVPQRSSVSSDSVEYYNYQAKSACKITVVATVTSGAVPSMFLSKSVERPNATTPDTISRLSSSGSGVLPKVVLPGVTAGQTLHIAVDGAGHNITYTIRVFETPTDVTQPPTLLTLPDGLPQEDAIPNTDKSWLYYQISTPIGHEALDVRLVVQVGLVEMSIARCPSTSAYQCAAHHLPNATNYLATTADSDRTSLKIYRDDAVPTLYVIGVQSLSFYSAYQISAVSESSVLELQPGVAVMDHVAKDEKDYFSFFLDDPHARLTIAITTLSGDPDIYVSTTVGRPGPDASTWSSTDYGPDVLTIDPRTDRQACIHCIYYIAVIGNIESTYTISVSTSSNMPRLVDGVPSTGYVGLSEWVFYTFHNAYGSGRDLHVNLVSATGNADLYITLDGSYPSYTNHAYISDDFFTADGVNILHTDAAYRPCTATSSSASGSNTGATDCMVIVAVYGFSASEYTLTLTSSSAATLLQLGVVRSDVVALGQYKNFRTLVSQSNGLEPYTLRFALTPSAGHVQLFVSCDNMEPNSTSHQWSLSSTSGSGAYLDVLSLSAVDKGCLRSSSQFYASVLGDSAASFTLMASVVGASNVPMLVPGQAHSAQASFQQVDYYFVRPGSTYTNIRLLASVLQGDVDLYVSLSWATRPVLDSQTGQMKSFVLSSAKSGSEDMNIDHHFIDSACANAQQNCYFIVAAVGAASASQYSILASTPDATLTLNAGVPRQSHVDSGNIEYFKFTITQPDLDVVISVTPISGDPDMYISMAPVRHPTQRNNSWFQSKFGADSITLQYRDTSKHCIPNPSIVGKHCDVFIGVFGWRNTTFTILASVNEGSRAPLTLIDASPQSGMVGVSEYTYYKYSISVPRNGGLNMPAIDIRFTLTPTDDGDADLFLLIEPKGNHTEPGVNNYDYRSVGWGSVTEMIELSAGMPHYCFDCTVYLAVYGYRACAYTIQASSSGIVGLQAGQAMGGHVSTEKFAYYSVHNANQFGVMKFTLTMISEDADLYIIAHRPNTPLVLPTSREYTWRSLNVGSDVVSFDYEDKRFCVDCDYIIGVYGYSNATFTLMVTDQEESIIKLTQNRPQIASIRARNGLLYFSVVIASSEADMTVTLTSLDTGYADMFVQVYDLALFNSASGGDHYTLPDPADPTTYAYTTFETEDDHVFLPGPHLVQSLLVICVRADSSIRFSIVATSSQSPVLLLSGVPQSHYVQTGVNEYFKFYPHADEDLHITLTARSGDPDLFVSTIYEKPHCTRVTNDYYTNVQCGNYTWSSRNYMTDQVIISRDSPCTAVMPGTNVEEDCDPAHAFNPGNGAPVYIGVYGYSAAQFTLLVSPVGQQIQLLAGQPQLSRTSPSYICTARSPTTGACTTAASANTKVEAAYFAFRIAGSANRNNHKNVAALESVFDVILSIVPQCNATLADQGHCAPGCDCAPLKVYVNSCPLSKCTQQDRKPSSLYGQHKAAQTVKQGSGSTIFLSSASFGKGTAATSSFCDPTVIGEDCGYYIAVVASPVPGTSPTIAPKLESAAFTITARTPGDVILIPCTSDVNPDGVQFDGEDTIPAVPGHPRTNFGANTHHHYELCSLQYTDTPSPQPSSESLVVELEQCAGSTRLYACADTNNCESVLPSAHSWGYFADETQSCVHSWDPKRPRDNCMTAPNHRASITLPQRVGNYFLTTNGTGKFEMRVHSTVHGQKAAPFVVFAGRQSAESARVEVQDITGNTVSLKWQQARILMPGSYNPIDAAYMSYTAYIIDQQASNVPSLQDLNVRLNTACGLKYAAELLPPRAIQVARATLKPTEQGTPYMTFTFNGLAVSTRYLVALVATCDSNCLRQLSKVVNDPKVTVSCNGGAGECKPQSVVYLSQEFRTTDTADDISTHDDDTVARKEDTWVHGMLQFMYAIMIILLIMAVGIAGYWLKNNWNESSEWVLSTFSSARSAAASWTGGNNSSEHGEDGFRSSHGLTEARSASAAAPGPSRSFFGFSSLPSISVTRPGSTNSSRGGSGRNKNNATDGVELESYKYAPPSIASSGERRVGAYDPIDFRNNDGTGGSDGGSTVAHIGEAIGSTASKLYDAASNALSAQNIDAWNPLHKPSTTTTSPHSSSGGYSALPPAAAPAPTHIIGDADDELTL